MTMPQFQDHKFMSAKEKSSGLRAWVTFLRHGLQNKHFTQGLYRHLTLHCAFIAHYDRGGFYATYFERASEALRFLSQFDPDGPGTSVEYGGNYWLHSEVAADLNAAMREAAGPFLPKLRADLRALEIVDAQDELDRAQARVYRLLHGAAR